MSHFTKVYTLGCKLWKEGINKVGMYEGTKKQMYIG